MLNLEQNLTYENRQTHTLEHRMNQSNKISIKKRDGKKEPLDLEKMHKVVFHACEGLKTFIIRKLKLTAFKLLME